MMTLQEVTSTRGMRVALGAAVIGLALVGWTLNRALRLDSVATAPATVSVVPGALDIGAAGPDVDVKAAVAKDLFAVDRVAPKERYHMPGEAVAEGKVEPSRPVVLGTALAADGTSFATVQFESSRLHMLRVGDHIGDYTVKTIGRGRVVFLTSAGTSLEILAPQQGS